MAHDEKCVFTGVKTENRKSPAVIEHWEKPVAQTISLGFNSFSICGECRKEFKDVKDFLYHQVEHKFGKHYVCPLCDKMFRASDPLTRHLHVRHRINRRKTLDEATYGSEYENSINCKSEERNRNNVLSQQAESNTTSLSFPKINSTRCKKKSKEIKCEKCGKVFAFQQSLKKHLVTHSNEKPCICDKCGKAFKTKSNLSQHKRTHLKPGDKFQCSTCDFTSDNHAAIHSHRQIHSKGCLICEICGNAYGERSNLTKHMRVHDPSRPFSCIYSDCPWKFKTETMRRAHMRSHETSQVPKFECEFCGFIFRHKHHLRRHERKKHAIDNTDTARRGRTKAKANTKEDKDSSTELQTLTDERQSNVNSLTNNASSSSSIVVNVEPLNSAQPAMHLLYNVSEVGQTFYTRADDSNCTAEAVTGYIPLFQHSEPAHTYYITGPSIEQMSIYPQAFAQPLIPNTNTLHKTQESPIGDQSNILHVNATSIPTFTPSLATAQHLTYNSNTVPEDYAKTDAQQINTVNGMPLTADEKVGNKDASIKSSIIEQPNELKNEKQKCVLPKVSSNIIEHSSQLRHKPRILLPPGKAIGLDTAHRM